MSRLEPFRKQAKQLVRWHREGNHSIGGRIRSLARYQHLTDEQALQLKFPLSTAQEIIANEAGFTSWADLKADVEQQPPVPKQPSESHAIIKAAVPVVFVSNVEHSAGFFREKLGFTIDFLHGSPPFYGGVSRDGASLHLRFVHQPVLAQARQTEESLLAAFITVVNVQALFDEYKSNGVPLIETLHKEPWGGPTFTVCAPDDNWICFAEA